MHKSSYVSRWLYLYIFSKCGLNVYNEENNKRKCILLCPLLTTLANNIATNECMYHERDGLMFSVCLHITHC